MNFEPFLEKLDKKLPLFYSLTSGFYSAILSIEFNPLCVLVLEGGAMCPPYTNQQFLSVLDKQDQRSIAGPKLEHLVFTYF